MKKTVAALFVSALILAVVCGVSIAKGFYYKNKYLNYKDDPDISINVYVGEDAYNYIINGTYFTGFMVLGGSAGVGAICLLSTGIYLHFKSKDRIMDGLKAIYEKMDICATVHLLDNINLEANENGESVY